jgi:CheY-like chemotaxis protein
LNIMVKLLNVKYNVFTATNAIEGLKVLKNTNIDLIVSDIMMPEMNFIFVT